MAHRFIPTTAIVLLAAQVAVPTTRDDVAVYEAVLAHTVRSEVDRFSSGAGLKTPAPVLAFDRTLMICRAENDHPKQMGCIRSEEVQSFEAKSTRMRSLLFEGKVSAESRAELGRSFRDRNAQGRTVAADGLTGLILVPPDQLEPVRSRESARTKGQTSFSTPAYSSDGHALVYVSYVCGGLCGYGWFFLLERAGQSWRVVDRVMLWIS